MGWIEDMFGATTHTGTFSNTLHDIFGPLIPPGTQWSYTEWPDINLLPNCDVDTSPLVLPLVAIAAILVLK